MAVIKPEQKPGTTSDKPAKRPVTVRLDADAPHSTQIDVPLGERRPAHAAEPSDKRVRWYYPVQAALFFTVLLIGAIVVWILPWRPTYSELEKRKLTEFPAFSAGALLSGNYFDDINKWFADTIPGRETWAKWNGKWQSLYGLSELTLFGEVANADDIPKTSYEDPNIELSNTEAAATDRTTKPTMPTTTQPTTKPTTTTTVAPRDKWDGGNIQVDKGETLNGILVMGNTAYEYYSFSQSASDTYIAALSRAADLLDGKAKVYDIVIPTSIGVMLPEDVRSQINSSDQEKAIKYLYGNMSDKVYKVPLLKTFREHNNEYLYFHTDHHWTARAAYYAYALYMTMKGEAPTPLSAYETREFTGFFGSFYRETLSPALKEDTVIAYLPTCDNDLVFTDRDGQKVNWNVIQDVTNWAASSKYNTFIGGDNPFTEITNHDRSDGSAALVIKESFGNAFVPFLVDHYEKVYVVDYRYYEEMNLSQVVDAYHIGDVIFINNIGATRSSSLTGYIADFVG